MPHRRLSPAPTETAHSRDFEVWPRFLWELATACDEAITGYCRVKMPRRPQAPKMLRISAANSRTRASSVSHEHMKRAPPLPMKV